MWASSRGQLSGLRASVIIPGGRRPGLVPTWATGSAGAPLSGRAATRLFRRHHAPNGILNLCTWLTTLATAAVLPSAYQLITAQSGR